MDSFSISQLSRFSGILPHTIRMWEQRYNALQPSRSEGNTRYYNNTQLRRLLNIVSLMDTDYKISELCSMSDEKLFNLVLEKQGSTPSQGPQGYFVAQLLAAGMSYDEAHFEKIFSHCLLRFGMKNAYVKVIYPLLDRMGLMWASDSIPPAQEHYISNLLRQKFFTAIDSLAPPKKESESWLLFLPENEFHELGLLLAHYLIRLAGEKSIYLGPNVPMKSLASAVAHTRPDKLLLFLVHRDLPEETSEYLYELTSHFGKKKIFVAADKEVSTHLSPVKKIQFLNSVEELANELPFINV